MRAHYSVEQIDVVREEIERAEGSLAKFSLSYERFGFHAVDGGVYYREWAPAAKRVSVIGDFSKNL